jgi:hypothetical protein
MRRRLQILISSNIFPSGCPAIIEPIHKLSQPKFSILNLAATKGLAEDSADCLAKPTPTGTSVVRVTSCSRAISRFQELKLNSTSSAVMALFSHSLKLKCDPKLNRASPRRKTPSISKNAAASRAWLRQLIRAPGPRKIFRGGPTAWPLKQPADKNRWSSIDRPSANRNHDRKSWQRFSARRLPSTVTAQ